MTVFLVSRQKLTYADGVWGAPKCYNGTEGVFAVAAEGYEQGPWTR